MTQTTVTAEAFGASAGATVQITPDDADPDTDDHEVALNSSGETPIEITVSSANAQESKVYRVNVTRSARLDPGLPVPDATMNRPSCRVYDLTDEGDTGYRRWYPDLCDAVFQPDGIQRYARFYRMHLAEEGEVRLQVNGSSTHLVIRSEDGTQVAHDGRFGTPQYYGPSLTRDPADRNVHTRNRDALPDTYHGQRVPASV